MNSIWGYLIGGIGVGLLTLFGFFFGRSSQKTKDENKTLKETVKKAETQAEISKTADEKREEGKERIDEIKDKAGSETLSSLIDIFNSGGKLSDK